MAILSAALLAIDAGIRSISFAPDHRGGWGWVSCSLAAVALASFAVFVILLLLDCRDQGPRRGSH